MNYSMTFPDRILVPVVILEKLERYINVNIYCGHCKELKIGINIWINKRFTRRPGNVYSSCCNVVKGQHIKMAVLPPEEDHPMVHWGFEWYQGKYQKVMTGLLFSPFYMVAHRLGIDLEYKKYEEWGGHNPKTGNWTGITHKVIYTDDYDFTPYALTSNIFNYKDWQVADIEVSQKLELSLIENKYLYIILI